MDNKRDLYEVLGVDKNSTQQEIKKAFKKLAKQYHPDISKEENAEEKFKEVQEAYAILSDDNKRQQYDQFGHSAFDQQGGYGGASSGFDFSDIFSEIFGGGGFGGFGGNHHQPGPNDPSNGRDMEVNITISFKDAVFGTTKELSIKREIDCEKCSGSGAKDPSSVKSCDTCGGQGRVMRQQQTLFGMAMSESICPDCNGKGSTFTDNCSDCRGKGRKTITESISVNFHAGVDNGAYMRVAQKGEGGHRGGSDGNLFLNIFVKEDKFFKRRGNDIYVEIPVDYTQVALGDSIDVPTIHGDVTLKIPSGTQTGSTLRIKSKGVKNGDQYVKVNVVTPKKMSSEMKIVLEQLKELDKNSNNHKSFFDNVKGFFK